MDRDGEGVPVCADCDTSCDGAFHFFRSMDIWKVTMKYSRCPQNRLLPAKQRARYMQYVCECFVRAEYREKQYCLIINFVTQQPTQSVAVQSLRVRATNYLRRLKKVRYLHFRHYTYITTSPLTSQDCPPSVPYTLAVHNSRSLSSSTENNQTLMRQVTANKEKLSRLEEEKEQLVLDLQLLTIKYEKEQRV